MSKRSDRELVRLCMDDSPQAFDHLVERYYDGIFSAAFRIVRDHDDASDVAQTAFVKAFQKLHTYKQHLDFYCWVYRIAVNESLDLLARRRNLARLRHDHVSPANTPEETYHQSELETCVHDAIMDMGISSRALIVLRYFADMSYQELSFVFEKPEKTIKSRLYQARRSLSRILQSKGIAATG